MRKRRTAAAQRKVVRGLASWSPHGRGRRSAISRSNKRKRMATRKKRRENGRRADPRGSNPHSYGESFSESGFICGSQKETKVRRRERRAAIRRMVDTKFIYLSPGFNRGRVIGSHSYWRCTRKIKILISRWRCIGIVRQRLRSVSIMRPLQTRSDVQM